MKLFIEGIEGLFEDSSMLKNINTVNSYSIKEKYIENGRIDILILDDKNNNIIIENKIYAADGEKQLERYSYFYKNAPIVYLTLDGKGPSESSKGSLEIGREFICISYEYHIKNWLEKCIKEMANKPIIRETLNQYLNLIKELTNQTSNNNMAKEIKDLILRSIEASKLIRDNYDLAVTEASLLKIEELKRLLVDKGLTCSIKRASRGGGDGLFVEIKKFKIGEHKKETFDLGINIELKNDHFFFCVVKLGENRGGKMNEPKFSIIKEYLHDKIPNLFQINDWTIGKASDFNIGINRNEYYLPTADNTDQFEKLAERILNFKNILNK